jgi:hypothetical protein
VIDLRDRLSAFQPEIELDKSHLAHNQISVVRLHVPLLRDVG